MCWNRCIENIIYAFAVLKLGGSIKISKHSLLAMPPPPPPSVSKTAYRLGKGKARAKAEAADKGKGKGQDKGNDKDAVTLASPSRITYSPRGGWQWQSPEEAETLDEMIERLLADFK